MIPFRFAYYSSVLNIKYIKPFLIFDYVNRYEQNEMAKKLFKGKWEIGRPTNLVEKKDATRQEVKKDAGELLLNQYVL